MMTAVIQQIQYWTV